MSKFIYAGSGRKDLRLPTPQVQPQLVPRMLLTFGADLRNRPMNHMVS